jgi:hypothetical protein
MSKEAVETVIGRAVLESDFREALFASPQEALASYELTTEEVAALKTIDAETMETLAGTLDERISKADWAGILAFGSVDAGSLGPDFKIT